MEKQTSHQVSSSLNEGILEVAVTGILSKPTVEVLRTEVFTLIRQHDAKAVLCDVRDSSGPHEIADAYFRSRNMPSDVMALSCAVVDKPENLDFKSFYETTAANAGFVIKWFVDVESARAWLRSRLSANG